MKRISFNLVFTVLLVWISGFCIANADDFKISSSRISILHLTDEAKTAIEAVSDKEEKTVIVKKACSQEDFAAICKLNWVKKLEFENHNKEIHDLSPLSHLKGLQVLKIGYAKASHETPFDMAPLTELKSLVEVNFYSTHITNTQAMSGLSKLRKASFYMSAIDSIDFLKGTPELRELNLYGTAHSFKNYEPLLGLKKLRKLNIYMNKQATDELLAPLTALISLEDISMQNCNKVTTLSFLANCKNLRTINANWCRKLSDISALANMDMLRVVNIPKCQVSSISVLQGMKYLERLDISETDVSDISALKGCDSLYDLNISDTEITDISILKNCPSLRLLDINYTEIKDLLPLAKCNNLNQLNCVATPIDDLTALLNCDDFDLLSVSEGISQIEIDKLKEAFPSLRVRLK